MNMIEKYCLAVDFQLILSTNVTHWEIIAMRVDIILIQYKEMAPFKSETNLCAFLMLNKVHHLQRLNVCYCRRCKTNKYKHMTHRYLRYILSTFSCNYQFGTVLTVWYLMRSILSTTFLSVFIIKKQYHGTILSFLLLINDIKPMPWQRIRYNRNRKVIHVMYVA
jgi:hypothetical protein